MEVISRPMSTSFQNHVTKCTLFSFQEVKVLIKILSYCIRPVGNVCEESYTFIFQPCPQLICTYEAAYGENSFLGIQDERTVRLKNSAFVVAPFSRHTVSIQVITGTSLVVEWLRICLPVQGMQVRSLVGELRSHTPRGN